MFVCARLAQYGRTLSLVAQYWRLTGDDALLLKHAAKLTDISAMLLARRRQAQQLPSTDPSYGLIRGAGALWQIQLVDQPFTHPP